MHNPLCAAETEPPVSGHGVVGLICWRVSVLNNRAKPYRVTRQTHCLLLSAASARNRLRCERHRCSSVARGHAPCVVGHLDAWRTRGAVRMPQLRRARMTVADAHPVRRLPASCIDRAHNLHRAAPCSSKQSPGAARRAHRRPAASIVDDRRAWRAHVGEAGL